MSLTLTKNHEKNTEFDKSKKSEIESKVTHLIIQLQISPIYINRILELFDNAKKTKNFNGVSNNALLAVCFYRINLEKKLYVSLKKINKLLNICSRGILSAHLRLYDKFCNNLNLKPIRYSLNDHVSNICTNIGLGDVIEKKAINLAKMINKNFLLPGENRTCAITSIYFAANFEGEPLTIQQLCDFFELMAISVLYDKIKIFSRYMKEYFRRKKLKMRLTRRERYFLNYFNVVDRDNFFRKFMSVKN